MKTMKDQVTSIEQSKRLIELEVPAQKASMVWVPDYKFDSNTRQFISTGSYEICPKHRAFDVVKEDVIPAFTVADLLILLSDMAEKCGVSIRIHQEVGSICYAVYVGDCLICPYGELPFVDMLVEAVIYLEPNYSKCYKS